MKTYKEILADLIKTFIDEQEKVTFFGKSSVARAIFSSIAGVTAEIWKDLYQIKRQIFPETSEGEALDIVVGRKGMVRQTATKSSAVLAFRGDAGTVIPINTQVRNANTGVIYKTLQEIVIQDFSNYYNTEHSNVVVAESIDVGSTTISKAGELTVLATPISGVTSVTNFFESTGGTDNESDSDLRVRYMERINILAQGTKAYYETIAKEYGGILAKAKFNPLAMGVDVYVLKNNLAIYPAEALAQIKNSIESMQRALTTVTVYNAEQKNINIYVRIIRDTNYSSEEVLATISQNLFELLDPRLTGFGYIIKYSDVLKNVLNSNGINEIAYNSLLLNNARQDIICNEIEIPRISSLVVADQNTEIIQQEVEYLYTE